MSQETNNTAPTADDPCDDCTTQGDLSGWTQRTTESQTEDTADKS